MTYNEKVILQKRLEKAEYLTRAQIASIHLSVAELNLQAETLSEQATILDNAQLELWKTQSED